MKTVKPSNPLISVIVPVYNVEAYLAECLDSIISQGYPAFEVLLIDDGSTDRCSFICDEYADKDVRIRVFHQENSGLSAARNTALDNAQGEYITMVDSDDLLLRDDYLQIMYDILKQNNASICLSGHVSFKNGDPVPGAIDRPEDMLILDGKQYAYWENIPKYYIHNCATGKLYSRELFSEIRFPSGRLFEDIAVQHHLTFPCERIVFSGRHMYGHRIRPDGLERGSSKEQLAQDCILAYQDRIDYYRSLGHSELAYRAEQMLLRWLNKNKTGKQP